VLKCIMLDEKTGKPEAEPERRTKVNMAKIFNQMINASKNKHKRLLEDRKQEGKTC